MPITARALLASLAILSASAAPAGAESSGVVNADLLRAEWTVGRTRSGQANVSGYLYNRSIMDAAGVWIRVDRLDDGGAVVQSHRGRIVGDVITGGRSFFEVPVTTADARYQVTVEAARWVRECR
ncbi:MAG TPA: hypothetical protein VIF59_10955 [Methylomirabilota bacterium]|jgi:hypothetical protein